MANITHNGNPVHTAGELPAVGSKAPEFTLVKSDLSEADLASFRGKKVILNISPSIDTSICATSVRKFNVEASQRPDTVVLYISADLPFAQKRFCGAEGLDDVIPLSTYRSPEFGTDYGVVLLDGKLKGLMSRVVIVLDEEGIVIYTEQVPEIAQEPDYAAALAALG